MPQDDDPASNSSPAPDGRYQPGSPAGSGLTDINSLFSRHAQSFYAASLAQTRQLMNFQSDGYPQGHQTEERRRGACRRQRALQYDGPERRRGDRRSVAYATV